MTTVRARAVIPFPRNDSVMSMPKQIRLNAFDMNCVGHIQHGMWAHPRDRSMHYTDLDHWVSLARTLERGLFDGLFLADILGVYDVFQGSPDASIRNAVQIPVNDPLLLIPAMAYATQHLGFGVTCNLTYEPPYTFARRMSTLDHLTKGRIGWNIVTGYLDSAARGMGLAQQPEHDSRYDVAEEYMQVVYQLWEGSWEDGAVLRDRETRVFADPARIHRVKHAGRHYKVDAIHLSEPSPQRTPVLYQAGASARGREFAAAHAECVFVNGQFRHNVREIVADIRARAKAIGRDPADIKMFVGATVVVAPTDAEAADKLAEYRAYSQLGGRFGALLRLGRRRFLALRTGRADPLCQDQRAALQPGSDHRPQRRHRMDAAQAAGDDGAGQPPGPHRRLAHQGRGRNAGLGGRGGCRRLQPLPHGDAGMRRGFRRPGGAGTAIPRLDEAGPTRLARCARSCSGRSVPGCRPATRQPATGADNSFDL